MSSSVKHHKHHKKVQQFVIIVEGAIFLFILLSLFTVSISWTKYFTSTRSNAAETLQTTTENTHTGIIHLLYKENFSKKQLDKVYVLEVNNRTFLPIEFATPKLSFEPESTIKVSGKVVDGKLKVSSSRVIKSASKPKQEFKTMQLDSPTKKKVAVIMSRFSDEKPTYTKKQVLEELFTVSSSVKSYYERNSYGKLSLEGSIDDIYGGEKIAQSEEDRNWYTIEVLPESRLGCDFDMHILQWATLARERANKLDNFNEDNYDHVIYLFPNRPGCNEAGGYAYRWEKEAYIVNVINLPFVMAHELGHNFGLHHANGLLCKDSNDEQIIIGNNCKSMEYADPYNVMGYQKEEGMYNLNAINKEILQWVDESETETIDVSQNESFSRSFQLYGLETDPDKVRGTRIIKIWRPVTEGYYYLEYRRPLFFDAKIPDHKYDGIFIHQLGAEFRSELIDTGPALKTTTPSLNSHVDFTDAALIPGKSFYDEINDITIKTESANQYSASVKISIGKVTEHVPSPTVVEEPIDIELPDIPR